MGNNIIIITINDKGYIVPIDKASRIAIYDADKHIIIEEVNNPYRNGFWVLEELFDKYDPTVLITSEISEELAYDIEENGVKIYTVESRKINDVLYEIFL